jgi:hypothetical protein
MIKMFKSDVRMYILIEFVYLVSLCETRLSQWIRASVSLKRMVPRVSLTPLLAYQPIWSTKALMNYMDRTRSKHADHIHKRSNMSAIYHTDLENAVEQTEEQQLIEEAQAWCVTRELIAIVLAFCMTAHNCLLVTIPLGQLAY